MRKFIPILVIGAIATSCASHNLKKADRYFNNYAYLDAKNAYLELANDGDTSDHVTKQLALCYSKLNDTENSEEWFSKHVAGGTATSEEVFDYSMALRGNEKYEESSKWMNVFHTMKSVDSRGEEFKVNEGLVDKLKADGAKFEIKNLESNSVNSDFGPMFYDQKMVFVSSRKELKSMRRNHAWNGKPFLDLYEANKSDDGSLSEVSDIDRKVNSKYHEGPVSFTNDYKTVYFTRNNYFNRKAGKSSDKVNKLKIYRADVNNGDFENIEPLPFNNDEYSVGHPSLTADGKWLYFASDMPGGIGGVDIYKAEVKSDGSFGSPINLGKKINTEGNEVFPFIHESGMLLFSSNGHTGLGGLDVFAQLVDKNGNPTKLINAGLPMNSSQDDFSVILDADQKAGYFASNRSGGKGDDDIYSFIVTKPFAVQLLAKGIVTDKRTNKILPGADVILFTKDGKEVARTKANNEGGYEFSVEPDLEYVVKAANEKYFDNQNTFSTIDLGEQTEIIANVDLEKDPGLALLALVTDAKTSEPIEGVKMIVTDNMTGEKIEYTTPANGSYLRPLADKKLNDRGSYNIELKKEGYTAKTVTYNAQFDKEGVYNVHEGLDLTLNPFELGGDLSKLIDIKPIYFDLGKHFIRPDAAIELDKIVKVMNENPTMEVELGSHTDSRGSDESNRALSDRRAKSSAAYIKERITNPDRISGKGYGESIPNTIDLSAKGGDAKHKLVESYINSFKRKNKKEYKRLHQLNRRTEFIIKKM